MRGLQILMFHLFLLSEISGFAQSKGGENRDFNIDISAGYLFRTTIFYRKDIGATSNPALLDPAIPYSFRKGINGTGLNLSIVGIFNSPKMAFKYTSTIRYDFLRINEPSNDHSFYFDHNFSLMKYFSFKNDINEKPKYIGVGYSILNTRASFNYGKYQGPDLPLVDTSFSLEFDAYRIFIGIPVWKIYLEPGVYIVDDDFPGPIKDSATMFYVEALYIFRIF